MDSSTIRRWAVASAVCIGLAAIWFALFENFVVVPAVPGQEGVTEEAAVTAYYAWYRDHDWQYLGVILLLTAGFLAMAGLGRSLMTLESATGRETTGSAIGWGAAGRMLIAAGLVGATAGFLHIGARQAIGVASDAVGRQGTASIIHYVVDMTFSGALGGALLLLGGGIAACAFAGRRAPALGMAWVALSGVTGVAVAAVGLQYLLEDPFGLREPMLLVVGVVLIPAWASILAGRVGERAPEHAASAALTGA
jgi:CDR ABC transporter